MSGIGEPYICEVCGGQFVKVRSDEDAIAEAVALYPAEDLAAGTGITCDDCFKQVMSWARVNMPEHLR